jgi:hypothetical protein
MNRKIYGDDLEVCRVRCASKIYIIEFVLDRRSKTAPPIANDAKVEGKTTAVLRSSCVSYQRHWGFCVDTDYRNDSILQQAGSGAALRGTIFCRRRHDEKLSNL